VWLNCVFVFHQLGEKRRQSSILTYLLSVFCMAFIFVCTYSRWLLTIVGQCHLVDRNRVNRIIDCPFSLNKVLKVTFCLFGGLGFELSLQSRHSTNWTTPPFHLAMVIFWRWGLKKYLLLSEYSKSICWVASSYSGGRDLKNRGLKPAQADSSWDPIWKKSLHKIRLLEWLEV
jgi:hypothetical protein